MYSILLRRAEHIRHYCIRAARGTGWEVTLEEDQVRTRHALYDDWHRVERALALFRREVAALSSEGWEATHRSRPFRRLVHEPVAEADHGLDLVARNPELPAQAADVHVHRPRLDDAMKVSDV